MPGKVKVRLLAGRNLPVMDRGSDTTDAFAEVKLGDTTYKTDVYRKSLNPAWNSDWFRFEADDLELQDEPLQIRIMDYDTYSANDAIGKVYVDLNPLLLPQVGKRPSSVGENVAISISATGGTVMSGWLPIFDTMHGIRGEVNVIIKVELFSDLNKFRQSSCGVQFFCAPEVPEGYKAHFLPGFVEELVVNDDPEYKWIDKIRTPRASNEARQLLFIKLSGEVRRKIGLKALELGGNAVIGYRQCFDLEGESGIVVRGIGTAATLTRIQPGETSYVQQLGQISPAAATVQTASPPRSIREGSTSKEVAPGSPVPDVSEVWSESPTTPGIPLNSGPNPTTTGIPHHGTPSSSVHPTTLNRTASKDYGINMAHVQKSTDSEQGTSGGSGGSDKVFSRNISMKPPDLHEMPEYPFVTINKFPPGFLVHLGGLVSSKSVKLIEELADREDGGTREAWWTELRQEVRSHAIALGCNMIVGYQEKAIICDDVVILSAAGTAAICNLTFMHEFDIPGPGSNKPAAVQTDCSACHIPYSEATVPFPIKLVRCGICGRGKVPDILLTTIEPPSQVEIVGRAGILQARVLRLKKDLKGENNAREVSDALPFLEYEIHRQLVNKLKVKGMNAIFGLQVRISLSDRVLVGLATGTAVYLSALPPPALPKILSNSNIINDKTHLARVHQKLKDKVASNREYFGLSEIGERSDTVTGEIDDDGIDLDLTSGNKDTCVLEVDDTEDADIVDSLLDLHPPSGFQVISIDTPVGVDPTQTIGHCQTFTQIWRGKMPCRAREFSTAAQSLVNAVCFKLRRIKPCLICSLQWNVEVDEESEVQLCLSGLALSLASPDSIQKAVLIQAKKMRELVKEESELMFRLDGVGGTAVGPAVQATGATAGDVVTGPLPPPKENDTKEVNKSAMRRKNTVVVERHPPYFFSCKSSKFGVNVTTMPYIPGARIENHLGNLNFFFIRESTSIRESGGLSSFVQSFMCEVLGILRSHVAGLGGNALTSYFMSECVLSHSPHKNQAQCLINIGGDVTAVTYVTAPKPPLAQHKDLNSWLGAGAGPPPVS